jgi:integration host factor subunit beta
MATVTKKELIDRIAVKTGLKRLDVRNVLQEFLDEMILELGNGNRLEFRDFGVFEIKSRAPRTAQNPKTLERVIVPRKKTVKFKLGRLLKQQLDEPQDGAGGNSDGGGPPHNPVKGDDGKHEHLDGNSSRRTPVKSRPH